MPFILSPLRSHVTCQPGDAKIYKSFYLAVVKKDAIYITNNGNPITITNRGEKCMHTTN